MKYSLFLFVIFFLPFLSAQASSPLPTSDKSKRTALEILEEVERILITEGKWGQNEEQECTELNPDQSINLFCALKAVSIQLTGKYKHRGALMKAVRKVIREVMESDEKYFHPIQGFNNDSRRTLDDIAKVIVKVRDRLGQISG